jgi:hypothetical protein
MVEFTMIFMIFMTIVVGIMEFSFLLTVKTGISFASQDATQLAAQLGNTADADCTILQLIDKDLQAPIDRAKVQAVKIFYTDSTGTVGVSDNWTKSGTYLCPILNVRIPWSPGTQGYPASDRCNILNAIGCTPHTSLDWIGVTISYQYSWITPLPGLVGLGGSGPLLAETHISRMEPVQ